MHRPDSHRGRKTVDLSPVLPAVYDPCVAKLARSATRVNRLFGSLSKPLVTIASLKFHARALSPREVEDMFKNGQLLVEVATGKGPTAVQSTVLSYSEAKEASNIKGLELVLQQNVLQESEFRKSDLSRMWAGQPLPVLQGPIQAVQRMDSQNRAYTSIVEDPVQVETVAAVDVNTLPELRANERCVKAVDLLSGTRFYSLLLTVCRSNLLTARVCVFVPWRVELFPTDHTLFPLFRSLTLVFWTRMAREGRVFTWYLDEFQPILHAWIEPFWTNTRWTNGAGATSGETGIDFRTEGIDTTYKGAN